MKVFSLPKTLDAIFFDIDGTLYDNHAYEEHQYAVLYDALALKLARPVDQLCEEIESWRDNYSREHGLRPSLGNSFERWGADMQQSIQWRSEYIKPEDFLTADARLRHTLSSLLEPGRTAIAVTNNPADIGCRTLQSLGVMSLFKDIIGLDTAGASKPNSPHFHIALERSGSRPENCLSVGDRYGIDIEPALKLGMGAILVDGVRDVYEIAELIRGESIDVDNKI